MRSPTRRWRPDRAEFGTYTLTSHISTVPTASKAARTRILESIICRPRRSSLLCFRIAPKAGASRRGVTLPVLDSALLSLSATLVTHQVSYSAAAAIGRSTTISHGHLGILWKFGLLAAVIGMAVAVLRNLKSRRYQVGNPTLTGAMIAANFTVLELVERAAAGANPTVLFSEAVFWLGLLTVFPITGLSVLVLRSVTEVATRFLTADNTRTWPTSPDQPSLLADLSVWGSDPLLRFSFVRGPPTFM